VSFETEEDRTRARQVAAVLADRWHCELCEFGDLATIDWYARRDRRLVALLELKCRVNRTSDRFPTTMLSLRKWMALTFAALALGVPPFFVVRFTDGIFFIDIRTLDTTNHCVTGRRDRSAVTRFDVEPAIEFPVAAMTRVDA